MPSSPPPKPGRKSSAISAAADLFDAPPPPPVALSLAERIACLRLIRSEGIGPATFRDLIAHTGSPEAALAALPELARRGGRARAIRICPQAQAVAELEAAERIGAIALFSIEPAYPIALAAVDAPPPLIYVKGDVALLARPAVAIVGSRQCSAAGHKLAGQFARALGQAGLVISSGLARGIDAAAHEASLATGTVAVLAGGVDNIYPPEHANLYRQIAEQGCIVSEMPPGFTPRAQDFPHRNRIISGISRGVLVIEAARRSGTLVTARLASEQGREVFAVPGHPLDPRAEGTNQLLKSGATLVTEADDVLEALRPSLTAPNGMLETQPAARMAGYPRAPFDRLQEPDADDPAHHFVGGDYDFSNATGTGSPPVRTEFLNTPDTAARTTPPAGHRTDAMATSARHGAEVVEVAQVENDSPGAVEVPAWSSQKHPADTLLSPSISNSARTRVLAVLGTAPAEVDSVARATGLPIQSVHIALLELGLGGHVTRHPGGLVSLAVDEETDGSGSLPAEK